MEDFFAPMTTESGMTAFQKKASSSDGLYRPKFEEAKDKKVGYKSVIRFLANLKADKTRGESAIVRNMHYVKLADPNYTSLNGYYDSAKSFGEKTCPLTSLYWDLRNSKSVLDNDKAGLIPYTTRFYSYIQIMEDEQHPELEGKIMIFPYGTKIKKKIEEEMEGLISGEKVNVFDLVNGKDFVLIINEVAGYQNYDSSRFRGVSSPIKINGKAVPTDDQNGAKVISANARETVANYLLTRENQLEDFAPKRWDADTASKVQRIIGILTNAPKPVGANNTVSADEFSADALTGSQPAPAPAQTFTKQTDPDSFFSFDD